MSDKQKLKTSMSDETLSNFAVSPKGARLDPCGPYEVFRNNTTAVEVIVKELPHKHKRKPNNVSGNPDDTVQKLKEHVDELKVDLHVAKTTLVQTRAGFKSIFCVIKKQLDTANQHELEVDAKNLALQLENEKLKMIAEYKTSVAGKLKKELSSLRRIIKCVIKGITSTPAVDYPITSEAEYDDFENYLKEDCKAECTPNSFQGTCTFDSSVSKEIRKSFEKQFY